MRGLYFALTACFLLACVTAQESKLYFYPLTWIWRSGKLPFECQKIAKNLTFFFLMPKIVIFWHFFLNVKVLTIFLHSYGNFPKGLIGTLFDIVFLELLQLYSLSLRFKKRETYIQNLLIFSIMTFQNYIEILKKTGKGAITQQKYILKITTSGMVGLNSQAV